MLYGCVWKSSALDYKSWGVERRSSVFWTCASRKSNDFGFRGSWFQFWRFELDKVKGLRVYRI